MKPIGKVGVSLLLLLVLAKPMMACLIPAIAMTAAERDCCKRMAGKGAISFLLYDHQSSRPFGCNQEFVGRELATSDDACCIPGSPRTDHPNSAGIWFSFVGS